MKISYFGVGFRMPLGVVLLLAAIGGALLVGIVGTARILQLRRSVRLLALAQRTGHQGPQLLEPRDREAVAGRAPVAAGRE